MFAFHFNHSQKLSVQPGTYKYVLQSLEVLFENIPNLIERLWEFYSTRLHPYAMKINKDCRMDLSKFMTKQKWSIAKFHVMNEGFLDQLIKKFKTDAKTVCEIFKKLNWSFLFKEDLKSSYLCKLFRLSLDVYIYSQSSIPSEISKAFDLENISNSSFVKKISNQDFIQQFDGTVFSSNLLCKNRNISKLSKSIRFDS
jgi:hypothetical protein